ncbi:hypothetical protein AAG906_016163 [Vitis piasezkii]
MKEEAKLVCVDSKSFEISEVFGERCKESLWKGVEALLHGSVWKLDLCCFFGRGGGCCRGCFRRKRYYGRMGFVGEKLRSLALCLGMSLGKCYFLWDREYSWGIRKSPKSYEINGPMSVGGWGHTPLSDSDMYAFESWGEPIGILKEG